MSLLSVVDSADLFFLYFIFLVFLTVNSFAMCLRACDGLLDAGPEYEKAFSEELTKLQRLYGNGDLSSFPEFKFSGEWERVCLSLK